VRLFIFLRGALIRFAITSSGHYFNKLISYPQVGNAVDAIKIACDFMSLDNITTTQQLVGELRQQRLSTSWGDDVLQFYEALWYAWRSLSRPTYPILPSEGAPSSSFFAEASTDDIQTTSHPSGFDPSDDLAMPMDVDPNTHALSMDVDPNTHTTAQCGNKHDAVTPSSAKVLRRRMFRKEKRAVEALRRNSAPKPGHDFRCPFATSESSRAFNIGGLIDHLYVFVFYLLHCR
jgi:hypothetical protein